MYVGKEFSIVSKMDNNMYLDVVNGSNAVINKRSGQKTQKFVFDYKSRTIINVANGKSLAISGNNMITSTTTSDPSQLFRYRSEMFANV
jgi:hypothetical protein